MPKRLVEVWHTKDLLIGGLAGILAGLLLAKLSVAHLLQLLMALLGPLARIPGLGRWFRK